MNIWEIIPRVISTPLCTDKTTQQGNNSKVYNDKFIQQDDHSDGDDVVLQSTTRGDWDRTLTLRNFICIIQHIMICPQSHPSQASDLGLLFVVIPRVIWGDIVQVYTHKILSTRDQSPSYNQGCWLRIGKITSYSGTSLKKIKWRIEDYGFCDCRLIPSNDENCLHSRIQSPTFE